MQSSRQRGAATIGVIEMSLIVEWDEPDYVSIKCRDPDGYIIEASWEPAQ